MFVRIASFQCAADRIDEVVARFERTAMPTYGPLQGFMGGVVLVDRGTGAGHVATYWESADSMKATEETGVSFRSQAVREQESLQIGDFDRLEILVVHRVAAPRAGSFVRVTDVQGSPSKLDDGAKSLEESLSWLESHQGFRSVIMGANRETGRMIVSTSWETAADLEASASKVQERRQAGISVAGGETAHIESYEVAFADVKEAVPV